MLLQLLVLWLTVGQICGQSKPFPFGPRRRVLPGQRSSGCSDCAAELKQCILTCVEKFDCSEMNVKVGQCEEWDGCFFSFMYHSEHFINHSQDEAMICDPHNLEHMDLIPEAPCLVAVGTDQLTADTYMLIIDKTVINSQLSRTGALTNFFAVFFIFNIRYPDELKLTLEFMQRCIFGINPHSGSKVQRKKGGKYMSTHPKLVAFSQRFQEILFFTDDRVS